MNLKEILIIPAVILIFLFPATSFHMSGQITEDIKKAFETGDADLLSKHFNENLTVNILGKEGEISREEARQQIKAFFGKNKINKLIVKFEGEKTRSNFLIATLITDQGSYRVNVFFKKTDSISIIHLLRIEKVNESSF